MKRSWANGKKLDKKDGGYQWLYYTKRWKQRRRYQLIHHPLCSACLADNHVKAATIVHHVQDHRGDQYIFFHSPLESLCKQCHDNVVSGSKVLAYQRGCDIHGKPYKTHSIYIDHNLARRGGRDFIE